MFNIKSPSLKAFILLGIILLINMAACSPGMPPKDLLIEEPENATEAPANVEMPEALATTESEPTVLLLHGEDADPLISTLISDALESLAQASSMKFVTSVYLTPEMITPEVQVLVGIGENPDLNNLAQTQPDTAFVAIGNTAAIVADNLSVIGDSQLEARQISFMAGYLSALISTDNKIIALIAEENPARDLISESYVVGARFYCGICHPLYPPYNPFPQWETVSTATMANDFDTIIEKYTRIGVEIIYIDSGLTSPELFTYLEESGLKVISDQSPDLLRGNWVGTLKMDPVAALEALWPELLTLAPGRQVFSSIVLVDQEMGLIPAGRYRVFENMAAELLSGMVSMEIKP